MPQFCRSQFAIARRHRVRSSIQEWPPLELARPARSPACQPPSLLLRIAQARFQVQKKVLLSFCFSFLSTSHLSKSSKRRELFLDDSAKSAANTGEVRNRQV